MSIEDKKLISTNVEIPLYERFKAMCREQDRTMSAMMTRLVRQEIDRCDAAKAAEAKNDE